MKKIFKPGRFFAVLFIMTVIFSACTPASTPIVPTFIPTQTKPSLLNLPTETSIPTDTPMPTAIPEPTLTETPASAGTIKIGSKVFTEEFIVAEIYAQLLENAGFTVER